MARSDRAHRTRRRARRQSAVWRAAPARNRARDVHRPASVVPRRTGRRSQSARKRRSRAVLGFDPRPFRHRHPAHRARHERRHGHLRPHRRAQLRTENRRRRGRRNPSRPDRDRRLSRRRGERVSALMEISGLHAAYGRIEALKGVDLTVEAGEIVSLIGANGAGKSTLLMTICGRPRPTQGRVVFDGTDLAHLPIFAIVRLGIAQVPEGRRIFPRMTVLENLQIGATMAPPDRYDRDLARVFELFPILGERRHQRGGTLSGGEQQMLAIARALMSRPRLLLLDEPSLGLAPLVAKQIFEVVRDLNRKEGLTVFLVEQNAFHALKLAHRGYVMVNGRITLSGSGSELLERDEIKTAYLEGGRQKAEAAPEPSS